MIVNALNYLMDNENLINIRAKEVNLRLLNKSEIKNNRLKWQLINTLLPLAIITLIIVIFGLGEKTIQMKKIFLLAILIIASLTLFFLNKNDTTFSEELSDFAVEDTASIQKVFFADKHGNSVL